MSHRPRDSYPLTLASGQLMRVPLAPATTQSDVGGQLVNDVVKSSAPQPTMDPQGFGDGVPDCESWVQ